MKILIITALVQFATLCSFAQSTGNPSLRNSKWKGHIESPESMDIIFDFKNDTVIVTSADMTELETMLFWQNGDTVKLKKISGTSPCDDIAIGSYHIEWQEKGDKIIIHNLADPCLERATAITSALAYFRVKK